MLKQTEGSHAVAEAIALCRPQVICAYPITPQTHIVEGLGGRAITRRSLTRLFEDAERDELEQVTFLDLNADVISAQLERESAARRTGPTAEAILRRIGTVASSIG